MRSERKLSKNLALSVPSDIRHLRQAAPVTFFIGTKKPIMRLTMVLTTKLISHPGRAKCPEESMPTNDKKKLNVTPIHRLICLPTFLIDSFSISLSL